MSLPETRFFTRFASWRHLRRCLVPVGGDVGARLARLAERDSRLAPLLALGVIPRSFAGPLTRKFVSALDEATYAAQRNAWVEKTPIHLHYVSLIERHVKDARFVHILRAGLPAIASLYSMSAEYPEQWGIWTVDGCVARWQEDVRVSSAYATRSNHAFISYERLVENLPQTLVGLGNRLTLRTDEGAIESIMANYKTVSSQVVDDEPWKSSLSSPIANRNKFRLDELWTGEEQAALQRRLATESRLLESLPYI